MKYGILDRFFYKPLYIVTLVMVLVAYIYAEYQQYFYLAALLGAFVYLVSVGLSRLHRPIEFKFINVRSQPVEDPLEKMYTLLQSQYNCRFTRGKKLVGRIEYGRGNVFWVQFIISNTISGLTAQVHCNSPIPENWWRFYGTKSELERVAMSVGYRAKA